MICPVTLWINLTKFAWTDFDRQTYQRAKIRCGQLYEDAPCLKKFIKLNVREYKAMCGK